MTFALLYNHQDAAMIAAEAQRTDLSNTDRQFGQKLWNGGLKDWAAAAPAPAPFNDGTVDDPTLAIVVNAVGVTKQQLVDWLRRLAPNSGCFYLGAIADDVANTAVEPWPPA